MLHFSQKLSDGLVRDVLARRFAVIGARVSRKKPLPQTLWRFCCECVFTFDESAVKLGRDPVRRWPRKKHLRWLAGVLSRKTHVSVIKSAQLMVTWLVAAAVVHRILTRRGYNVAWYCRTATQAAEHVERRLSRIIQLIPPCYDVPRVELNNGVLEVFHDEHDPTPTSRVQPMAAERHGRDTAASAARSETWSLIVRDEAAFDPNDEEIHFSGLPRATAMWRVSTPNGANFHCRLMYSEGFGDVMGFDGPPDDAVKVGKDIWRWYRNGFVCVMVLHNADPDRDVSTTKGKAWHKKNRALSDARKWAREQRGSTRVPAGRPVFVDVKEEMFQPLSYDPKFATLRGWDWGWNGMPCLFAQLIPVYGVPQCGRRPDGGPDSWKLKILFEMFRSQAETLSVLTFGADVVQRTNELFPGAQCYDFGDVSGAQHAAHSDKTVFELLQGPPLGLVVRSRKMSVPVTLNMLQWLISRGWLEVEESSCPLLRAALEGGYSKDDYGEPIKDGLYDHLVDALRYLVGNLFIIQKGAGGDELVELEPKWRGRLLSVAADQGREISRRDTEEAGRWRGTQKRQSGMEVFG